MPILSFVCQSLQILRSHMRSNHWERDKVSTVKLKLQDIDRTNLEHKLDIPNKMSKLKKNSLNNKPAGAKAGEPLTITNTAGKSQTVNM